MNKFLNFRKTRLSTLSILINGLGWLFRSVLQRNHTVITRQFLLVTLFFLGMILKSSSSIGAMAEENLKIANLLVESYSPAAGATGIPIGNTAITITFNENYKTVDGKTLRLMRYHDDATLLTKNFVDGNTCLVNFTNTYSFNFEFTSFNYKTKFYILIDEGAFVNCDDEPFVGIANKDTWSFTIEKDPNDDETGPSINYTLPVNVSTETSRINTQIFLRLNEYANSVEGKEIQIRKYDDDVSEKTFTLSASQSINNEFSFPQEGEESYTLSGATQFYVWIEAGAFADQYGNESLEFNDKDAWKFTTKPVDLTTPSAIELFPENNTTEFFLFPYKLSLAFDENVYLISETTGKVSIFKTTDSENAVIQFAANELVNGSTDRLDLYLENSFEPEVSYFITIDNNTFRDQENNVFPGFSDQNTWTFSTRSLASDFAVIANFFPTRGATDVSTTIDKIRLTSNEEIWNDGGTIRLRKSDDKSLIKSWAVDEDIQFSYNEELDVYFTDFPLDVELTEGTDYYIDNQFNDSEEYEPGILGYSIYDDETESSTDVKLVPWSIDFWSFTTLIPDSEAPTVASLSPQNGATEVSVSPQLTIEFSENIVANGGSLLVKSLSDHDLFESIAITENEINGNTITVELSNELVYSTQYYIDLPLEMVKDATGNLFAGQSGNPNWQFTTEAAPDTQAPQILSLSPANESENAPFLAGFEITFDEPIFKTGASGSIRFYRASDDVLLTDRTTDLFTVSGNKIYADSYGSNLPRETEIYVLMDASLIADEEGNEYGGITETNQWRFTTESKEVALSVYESFSPSQNEENVSLSLESISFQVSVPFTIRDVGGNLDNTAIHLYDITAGNQIVKKWSLTGEDVSIDGSTITINNLPELDYENKYAVVQIGRFESIVNGYINYGALLSDNQRELIAWKNELDYWTFTTEAAPDTQAPQIVSFHPDNNQTIDREIEVYKVVFDEPISIFSSAGLYLREFDTDRGVTQNNLLTFARKSGDTLIIDRSFFGLWDSPKLASGTKYYFYSESTGIRDELGNSRGLEKGDLVFTTSGEPGMQGPEVGEAFPAVGAEEVSVDNWIFKFKYLKGSINSPSANGILSIREYENDNIVASMNAYNRITSEDTMIFDLTQFGTFNSTSMKYGTKYYVDFPANNIRDSYNYFLVPSKDQWTFTTEKETQAPQILSLSPANESENAPFLAGFEITFDEPIFKTGASGSIRFYRASDDVLLTDRTTDLLTVSGNKIYADSYGSNLPRETEIYALMDAGLIADELGNEFGGIIETDQWRFTTESKAMAISVYESFSPAQNAENVSISLESISFQVSVPFTIRDVSGNLDNTAIHLYDITAGNQIVKKWSLTGEDVSIDGSTITINNLPELTYESKYAVVQLGRFESIVNGYINYGALLSDNQRELIAWKNELDFWTFTTESALDTQAPQIVSLSPENGATDVSVTESLVITFDEPVKIAGNGATKVLILKGTDGTNTMIDLTDTEKTSIENEVVTINYAEFNYGTSYYILLADDVFEDHAGNWFKGGWSTNDVWSFTTAEQTLPDTQSPQIVSLSPSNGATDVSVTESLVITFDEPVRLPVNGATKQIILWSNGNNVAIDLTDQSITQIEDKKVTISYTFSPGTSYYLTFEDDIIEDHAGNWFKGGWSADDVWSFTTEKLDQTIIFEEIADVDLEELTGNLILNASASSDLPVSFAVVSGKAEIVNGNELAIAETGAIIIKATQAGNEVYLPAADVLREFNVFSSSKEDQIITTETQIMKTFGDVAFNLEASTGSNLPVIFSKISGPVSLDGAKVTINGAGIAIILASQQGNEAFNPAPSVRIEITINKANQSIIINDIEDKFTSSAPFEVVASASSNLSLIFAVNGPASIANNVITLSGQTGTVTVTVSQLGNENYESASNSISFEVIQTGGQAQSITFETIVEKTFGDLPFELNVGATSELPINLTFIGPISINGTTVTILGAGEAVITVRQSGNETFAPAQQVVKSFTIKKAAQQINFASITDKIYGNPAFALNASATSGLPVSYELFDGAVSVGAGQVVINGTGNVTIKAKQNGDNNYLAAQEQSQSFTINKASLLLTADSKTITFGDEFPELTYTISGFVYGENETVLTQSISIGTSANTDAGSYPISVSGGAALNYEISYQHAVLTILKATATITLENLIQDESGEPKMPKVTTDPDGLNFTITFNGSVTAPVVAGSYTVEVIIDEINYTGSTTGILIVNKILGINSNAINVSIFPNPTNEYVQITSSQMMNTINIQSLSGILMTQNVIENTSATLDVSGFASGIYLVVIYDDQGNSSKQKLIIK